MKNLRKIFFALILTTALIMSSACSAREQTFTCDYFSISLKGKYEYKDDPDYVMCLTGDEVLFTSVILQKGSETDVFSSAEEYLKYSLYQIEHYGCTIETFKNDAITYLYTDYSFSYDSEDYRVFVAAYENEYFYLICSFTVKSAACPDNIRNIKSAAESVIMKSK